MADRQRRTLTLTSADQRTYPAIAFDVPPHIARMAVTYRVEVAGPGDWAVDIGLRDPDGLRGWSGSARTSFFISPHDATPGYQVGPLSPGRWAVILGAYKIPNAGCTVTVDIEMTESKAEWLVGELHAHTTHSDGRYTLDQLCALAMDQDLDFLALTDHNTVSQNIQAPLNLPLLLLPGMEVTTYLGHANLYGVVAPQVDPLCRSDQDVRHLIREAHAQGAFISINHPFDPDLGWCYTFDLPVDAIEIWNGYWDEANSTALAYWQEQLVAGRRLIALGGSDFHGRSAHESASDTARLPVATRIYAAERSMAALRDGLRQGHVMVTGGVTAPVVEFSLDGHIVGDVVTVQRAELPLLVRIDPTERCLVRLLSERGRESEHIIDSAAKGRLEQNVASDRQFYRLEIWADDGGRSHPLVLTNPIFLEQ